MTLIPGGVRGVELKSKWPYKDWYVEMFGFERDDRNKFSVSTDCSISLSHSDKMKLGSQVASSALKCDLNVWIARSAKFVL